MFIKETGVEVIDCEWWNKTCEHSEDVAWVKFNEETVKGIKDGKIKNHFGIDYWKDGDWGSLRISDINVAASGKFEEMCPIAKLI